MLRVVVSRVGLGALLFFGAAGFAAACGTASVLECQAQAVAVLPRNVDDIDVGVTRELARRIQACEQSGDGGR